MRTDIMTEINVTQLKVAYHKVLQQVLGHLETVRRLDRAFTLLALDRDYLIEHGECYGRYTVYSPNGTYLVDTMERTCTCPDSEAGHLCKHRLALRIYAVAKLEEEL